MTVGAVWQLCGHPHNGCDGIAYPVALGKQLVNHSVVRDAYVRNLGVGATHGAAVPALCVENLLGFDLSTMTTHDAREGRLTHVTQNSTTRQHMRNAYAKWQSIVDPVDIVLLEFSVNGIQWLDQLLSRLRGLYPQAVMLYVDHFRLLDWRHWRNASNPAHQFRMTEDFSTAPECTHQLDHFLKEAGVTFWSLRKKLVHDGWGYQRATQIFHADKIHLRQWGHSLIGDGLWQELSRQLNSASVSDHQQSPLQPPPQHLPTSMTPLGSSALSQATNALPHRSNRSSACYFWYRNKRVPREVHVEKHPNWSLRGQLTASEGDSGKYTFELMQANRTNETQQLSLSFPTSEPCSVVRIGYMLHCCLYGVARFWLDGIVTAHVRGSVAGFPHHVLETTSIGTVRNAGRHTLTVQVVEPGPNGLQQFRLAGVFIGTTESMLATSNRSVWT